MFASYRRRAFNISAHVVYVLLLCALLFLCGLDIFLRVYLNRSVLIAAGSSLCMLVVATILIVSARNLTVRAALHDIPKLYVPINPSDLPQRVHRLIQADMSRVATIAAEAKPLPTPMAPPHLLASALHTLTLLEAAAAALRPIYVRRAPEQTCRAFLAALTARDLVRADLARFYVERYEALRFGGREREFGEEEWREFMKLFALLLRSMQNPQGGM
ncbi:hypothetical protein HDU89_006969 [Geranomyces variabilis]|nr:hypothetical protein HDU89_006969 [Geranomyces variabilis]